jgi:anti-sigma B factor antagonist
VDLACRHQLVGDQPVLAVEGAVDMATVPLLRDELLRLVHRHRGDVVLADLDGVTVLDDTGLGILLGAAATARRDGGDLVVICSLPALVERFAVTGLDRAIVVRPRVTR